MASKSCPFDAARAAADRAARAGASAGGAGGGAGGKSSAEKASEFQREVPLRRTRTEAPQTAVLVTPAGMGAESGLSPLRPLPAPL